jgi:hypothetical protein
MPGHLNSSPLNTKVAAQINKNDIGRAITKELSRGPAIRE